MILTNDNFLLTEKQIIKDCRHGVKSSQYELVKRYSGMLMTVCRRYASDEDMAKDMLQETFIRIFKYIHNYKPSGSFEAWMRKIAVNAALQWLNKKFIKQERGNIEELNTSAIQPDIYSQFNMEELINLIQQLPEGYRAVFNLNIIEGYNHKEIGERLGISESTSRSQLARARRMLQEQIKKEFAAKKKVSQYELG